MIVNQLVGIVANGNRPIQGPGAQSKGEPKQAAVADNNANPAGVQDSVQLDAQRLIVNENLNASEAVIPDQNGAGDLMDMLKKQLETSPANALGAQTGKLEAIAARLLDNI